MRDTGRDYLVKCPGRGAEGSEGVSRVGGRLLVSAKGPVSGVRPSLSALVKMGNDGTRRNRKITPLFLEYKVKIIK